MTRVTTHPGEILEEDFLVPLGMSQTDLANKIGVPVQRINEIINGKRGVTPETAVLFEKAFGVSADFWMNIQTKYDLTSYKKALKNRKWLRELRT